MKFIIKNIKSIQIDKDIENEHNFWMYTFDFKEKNHLDLFLKEAEEAGFHGIRGHRDVGGVRVSLYNSIEIKAVEKFSSFFDNFMKKKL